MDALIKLFNLFIGKVTYESYKPLTAGQEFENTAGFFILVKTAGNVTFTPYRSTVPVTDSLPEGWFPVKVKKIHSTTAVNLGIGW